MNAVKKLDRFKQWAGEKMGGEAKTGTSEDFKALEAEMNLRHEGMRSWNFNAEHGANWHRHGEVAEVNDRLCQISLQTHRGGCTREAASSWILGRYDDNAWTRLPARL
jgi:hypothetical protein